MRSYHKKRLLKLADGLRKVPRKNFNLETIVTLNIDDSIKSEAELIKLGQALKKQGISCKSSGCAVGIAPILFPRHCKWVAGKDCVDGVYYAGVYSKNEGIDGLDWAKDFFGLTYEQCDYLFMPDAYRKGHNGPLSVASRIENFVKNGCKKYANS
jgi:hypothetical protein